MMYLNLMHRLGGPLYQWQQDLAHKLQLKVTLAVPVASLFDAEKVKLIKAYQRDFGDEISIWFAEYDIPEIRGQQPIPERDFLWLCPRETKQLVINKSIEQYRKVFDGEPVSGGCYHLDAECMEFLRRTCPTLRAVVAGCFEEGVKVFHGCNNSWYLFNEGMPWGPWYPAKSHTLRPAENAADWTGVVAVPHLTRDLVLSYEGRNDFWASHPANVQRGLGNEGPVHCYDFNLVDQYRSYEKYNDGYSYYNVHVSSGWLQDCPNLIDSNQVTQNIYREQLQYLVELKNQGQLQDMHLSEFGAWYRKNVPLEKPQVALAKEILYGSGKHYFWYVDPSCRVLIDTAQGGSIGDLRPYAAKYPCSTGPHTQQLIYGSYPYLIHSQYRTGYIDHYADGSRTTLLVQHGQQQLDLCAYPTRCAKIERDAQGTHLHLSPVTLKFRDGFQVTIETRYHFPGGGVIGVERLLTNMSDPAGTVTLDEYIKACYGITEYPQDMRGIELSIAGNNRQTLTYRYAGRNLQSPQTTSLRATIPAIQTELRLETAAIPAETGIASEGYLFNPYFTFQLRQTLRQGQTMTSRICLAQTPGA